MAEKVRFELLSQMPAYGILFLLYFSYLHIIGLIISECNLKAHPLLKAYTTPDSTHNNWIW